MFTGLIQGIGVIEQVDQTTDGRQFTISSPFNKFIVGESIACDGACLTVLSATEDGIFAVAAVHTTLARTTMGGWSVGRRVNLERAIAMGERLGGHFVLGHVDGVGRVTRRELQQDALLIDIEVPEQVERLLIPHGSVAVDGISLTVNALLEPRVLQVSIIGHTRDNTTIGEREVGDGVHLEGDVLGKYVQRLLRTP